MANDKQQSGLMFNALTAGSKIVGNITADSDYRIDGLVEGDLQCTGKVVIGEAGKVKGTIGCQNAEIMGLLEGKISCSTAAASCRSARAVRSWAMSIPRHSSSSREHCSTVPALWERRKLRK